MSETPEKTPTLLETPVVREEEKRGAELATGSEAVSFSGKQGALKEVLARLASKGVSVAGADALLQARADGMTSADLAALQSSVDGAVREADGKALMTESGSALAAMVKGGQDVAESGLFTPDVDNGLKGLGIDIKGIAAAISGTNGR